MLKTFFATNSSLGLLMLRITLGLVILPHGLQKTLGLFGGYGLAGTYSFFTTQVGLPAIAAVLIIMAESLGAAGLILGFATRLGALGIAAVMTGAIVLIHWQNGFFMNWSGQQAGEGFEYHLLALGIALVLLVKGGGAFSVDRAIADRQ